MHINEDSVKKLASLARLSVSAEESARLIPELESILTYVDRLASVKVDATAPFDLATQGMQEVRTDVVHPFIDRDALMTKDRFKDDLLVTKGVFTSNDDAS